MNNIGIAQFSLFEIDAWKYIFKVIIFIHVAFIHKIEVFSKIFIWKISNIRLILYFSHIFILNPVLQIISRWVVCKVTAIILWPRWLQKIGSIIEEQIVLNNLIRLITFKSVHSKLDIMNLWVRNSYFFSCHICDRHFEKGLERFKGSSLVSRYC